jgi:alpha-glucosidase
MATKARSRGDWPAHPVIYQIYPRSFADTTGTGEGDLPGITKHLDHVAALGADAIWLSPFFVSPFVDGGYDIVDHCAVDPRFGTMADFDRLVARAHELDLRVMIDQVFNHTSSEHPWFEKSLDREDGFEDLYVWADARPDGSPPTNWIAFFGHPCWRWYPRRAQYCLHKFLSCQPCLNHHHPAVHDRLHRINRFWRDRGVDGFRYDAVTSFFHDRELRDNPPAGPEESGLIPGSPNNPYTFQTHAYDVLPRDCAAFTETMREWAGEDMYLLGEVNKGPDSIETNLDFTAEGRFDACYCIDIPERGVSSELLREILLRLDGKDGHAWWLSSHDQPRHVSAWGDGGARDARMFAGLHAALPGPLLIFQGEELGQPQAELTLKDLHDPFDIMYWPEPLGRDGARTPMAWDTTRPRCGFSGGKPWLPVQHPEDGGAAQQDGREGSVLEFYRAALRLRHKHDLADARMEIVDCAPNTVVARIETGEAPVTVMANLCDEPRDLPGNVGGKDPILASIALGDTGLMPPRSTAWWI